MGTELAGAVDEPGSVFGLPVPGPRLAATSCPAVRLFRVPAEPPSRASTRARRRRYGSGTASVDPAAVRVDFLVGRHARDFLGGVHDEHRAVRVSPEHAPQPISTCGPCTARRPRTRGWPGADDHLAFALGDDAGGQPG